MNILLIEDTEDVAETVKTLLELKGHEVTWADNGLKAQAHLRRTTFDFIICDCQMPIADGVDVLRFRQTFEITTPIVMFTGSPEEYEEKCMELGALAVITKGVDGMDKIGKLMESIEAW